MAQLIYSRQALVDLDRLIDLLLEVDAPMAPQAATLITEAVQVMANHPLIGRGIEAGLRELIISRGRTAYVALYSYEPADDSVLVLAIRHSREAGYPAE
ncbi:type II toxin-antitoxin system RelE/ParE family toxin [Hydrocarboniphaga sp.]|uniref:type II toxin-antitoxin system RelE/ParE family toxin n=1 Tax=Hydrocarboniphaga sp. TaxID=2033016 RepID=UPI003D0EDC20